MNLFGKSFMDVRLL